MPDSSSSDTRSDNFFCSYPDLIGKDDKYKEIPILPETADILQKYIRTYQLQKTSVLFGNVNGELLIRQGIRYIIRKYVTIAKLDQPNEFEIEGSPHLLRHSKATHLVDAGVKYL